MRASSLCGGPPSPSTLDDAWRCSILKTKGGVLMQGDARQYGPLLTTFGHFVQSWLKITAFWPVSQFVFDPFSVTFVHFFVPHFVCPFCLVLPAFAHFWWFFFAIFGPFGHFWPFFLPKSRMAKSGLNCSIGAKSHQSQPKSSQKPRKVSQ